MIHTNLNPYVKLYRLKLPIPSSRNQIVETSTSTHALVDGCESEIVDVESIDDEDIKLSSQGIDHEFRATELNSEVNQRLSCTWKKHSAIWYDHSYEKEEPENFLPSFPIVSNHTRNIRKCRKIANWKPLLSLKNPKKKKRLRRKHENRIRSTLAEKCYHNEVERGRRQVMAERFKNLALALEIEGKMAPKVFLLNEAAATIGELEKEKLVLKIALDEAAATYTKNMKRLQELSIVDDITLTRAKSMFRTIRFDTEKGSFQHMNEREISKWIEKSSKPDHRTGSSQLGQIHREITDLENAMGVTWKPTRLHLLQQATELIQTLEKEALQMRIALREATNDYVSKLKRLQELSSLDVVTLNRAKLIIGTMDADIQEGVFEDLAELEVSSPMETISD